MRKNKKGKKEKRKRPKKRNKMLENKVLKKIERNAENGDEITTSITRYDTHLCRTIDNER